MTKHEEGQQKALFEWAAYMEHQYPALHFMYHTPNGGSRNKIEAANLKAAGVKAGVPDICLPAARRGYHGLYIEMKHGDNKTSDDQDDFIAYLTSEGYMVEVCTAAKRPEILSQNTWG